MLKRDKAGIVCQHPTMDGGDSCARTGPLAAAGSAIDLANLAYFVTSEKTLVRHPGQPEWNDDKKTSRDNVVQWAVADQQCQRPTALKYAKAGRVNADYLSPSVRLYLYKIARVAPPLWIKVLGYLNLLVDLVWNTKVKPDEELNQFTCICSVMGQFWSSSLLKMHPNLEANMTDYWCGWRMQPELKDALLSIIKKAAQL